MVIDTCTQPRTQALPGRGFLAGRTALVTGAARRIGRVLALELGRQGVGVVLHYHGSQAEALETAAEIEADGGEVRLIQGDLADPLTAAGLVDLAAQAAGRPLDILVNNAAIFEAGDAAEVTVEQWDRHQAVNLRAPFLLAQALARQLPAGRCGDVVNLNDYRALRPGPDHFAYTISKVGLHGLTRGLALALAPLVRVNELALGAVLPPEQAPQDYLHTLRDEIPTRRFGSPDEVSSALLFVLANGSLTGQTLCLDGGRHLT